MTRFNILCKTKPVALALLYVVLALPGNAQLGASSQEVWPSVDVYYRVNNHFRLYGTTAATKKESTYSDGALGLFVDYLTFPFVKTFRPEHPDSVPGKYLWLRAGYMYSSTPPSSEDPFKESMIVTEANARVFLPVEILMTIKTRLDWRINNGDFKVRYRPRITLEKDMRTQYLFFTTYGYLEYYVNFGDPQVDRLKSQIGFELRVTKIINYEIFWNHQFANAPEINENDAFGMTLKFYLDKHSFDFTKNFKNKFKKKDKPATQ